MVGFNGKKIGNDHDEEVRLHRRLTSEAPVRQLESMEQLKRSRYMARFVCTYRDSPTSSMIAFDVVPAASIAAETVDAAAVASVL